MRVAVSAMTVMLGGCQWILGLTPLVPDAREHDAAFDDAAIDARPPDSSFDLATCPADYTTTISTSTSKYRLIMTTGTVRTVHADCKDDLPGATHLVAFQTV